MALDTKLSTAEAGRFHTTQWSVVLTCANTDAAKGNDALAELCQKYWPPLYVFARRHGRSPEDAKDLVQGFFLHMIEERSFARADPARGRFRNFLLGAFTRFLASESQRSHAQKRGGFKTLVHRFRREFGAMLRREVLATLSDPADLEDELRHLRSILMDILL
jgi:RNA polymerase sigma-70 factor (ECF subfamily)